MCKNCGACDAEHTYSIDDAADWVYNDTIFGRAQKTSK